MLDQALRSFQDAFAIKGIRRVLWFSMVLTLFVVCFESHTNYFEISAISKRLEVVEKASQQPLPAEQAARITKLKSELLHEIEVVQLKRANPSGQFFKIGIRFLKGAWMTVPLFWLIFRLVRFFLKESKSEDRQVRGMLVYFGWLGMSAATWVTTLLGFNSILWNTSENIFFSWVVFPLLSAGIFVVTIIWIVLLRTLLPSETRRQPTSVVASQEQAQ